jgi:aryl-alcohol dehydrogenase-like predicted oxidoreductase
MKTTTIKGTDLRISMFCLGGQSFGSRDSQQVSYAMLDQFVEAGGNFLDTANNYAIWNGKGGESETMIGQWMAERGNRDQLVVATKMGAPARDAAMGSRPEDILRECDRSLKRLQTDHIDLYYFHCDDRKVPLADQLGTMDRLVKAGKIRQVGASNFKAWRLAEAAAVSSANDIAEFCCVQQRYTYLRPHVNASFGFQISCNSDLLEYCGVHNFQLIAYSPLLGGAYIREDRPIQKQYRHRDSDVRKEVLFQVAEEIGATPNQVILAWMTGRGVIPITGASNAEQMSESIAGFDLILSDEILDRLDGAGARRD